MKWFNGMLQHAEKHSSPTSEQSLKRGTVAHVLYALTKLTDKDNSSTHHVSLYLPSKPYMGPLILLCTQPLPKDLHHKSASQDKKRYDPFTCSAWTSGLLTQRPLCEGVQV